MLDFRYKKYKNKLIFSHPQVITTHLLPRKYQPNHNFKICPQDRLLALKIQSIRSSKLLIFS